MPLRQAGISISAWRLKFPFVKKKTSPAFFLKARITAFFTIISRITGLVRSMLLAHFLGTSHAGDAFVIAFMIPNLLRRLFAEGALTSAFIPVFTEISGRTGESSRENQKKFFSQVFTVLILAVGIVSVLGVIAGPLLINVFYFFSGADAAYINTASNLLRIMFPYLFFISLAALVQAVLNSHGNFSVPAFTPVLLNASMIVSVFILKNIFALPAYAFSCGVLAGGILQLAFQIPWLLRLGYRFAPRINFQDPALRKMFYLMLPVVFSAGIYQINIMLLDPIALSLGEGAASSLNFSTRLQELPLGVFAVSISTVALPLFSRHTAEKKWEELGRDLLYALRLIFILFIPAVIFTFLLNREIITAVYYSGNFRERSLELTSACLLYHIAGALFVAMYRVIQPIYYSLQDTKTPVKIAGSLLFVNLAMALLFSRIFNMNAPGIALASCLNAFFYFFLLFFFLRKKIPVFSPAPLLVSLLAVCSAMLLPGLAIWTVKNYFPENLFIRVISGFGLSEIYIVKIRAIIKLLGGGLFLLPVYIGGIRQLNKKHIQSETGNVF